MKEREKKNENEKRNETMNEKKERARVITRWRWNEGRTD